MDVEAPEDGVMAKIVVGNGEKNVQVGRIIAMLAEEGDDISNVEVPSQATSSEVVGQSDASSSSEGSAAEAKQPQRTPPAPASSSHQPSQAHVSVEHGERIFPSVARLLAEHHLKSSDVKGTGVRGMLTKGDVLTHVGLANNPSGSAKSTSLGVAALGGPPRQGDKKVSCRRSKCTYRSSAHMLKCLWIALSQDGRTRGEARSSQSERTAERRASPIPDSRRPSILLQIWSTRSTNNSKHSSLCPGSPTRRLRLPLEAGGVTRGFLHCLDPCCAVEAQTGKHRCVCRALMILYFYIGSDSSIDAATRCETGTVTQVTWLERNVYGVSWRARRVLG